METFKKIKTNNQKTDVRQLTRKNISTAFAVAAMLVAGSNAYAVEFDTGNPDLSIRWDNTLKYNIKFRAEDINPEVPGPVPTNPAFPLLGDDADLGFEQWDVINNRIDISSELDIVWKEKFGLRVSGAGWYDNAYSDRNNHPGYNKYLAASQGVYTNTWGSLSVAPGEITDDAEFLHYRGAELLDAFVFANFDFGDNMGASVRAGRHTIYWGNSLLFAGAVHGIAGGMTTIDGHKAFSVPGTEAKELFRPTTKISGTLQLSPNLSLVGYYSLEFEEHRLPYAHTYHSQAEGINPDDEFVSLNPGLIHPATLTTLRPRAGFLQAGTEKPDDTGEWGVGINYYMEDSGWDLGLYFVNYHDKLPQGLSGAMNLGQFAGLQAAGGSPLWQQLLQAWPLFNNGAPADNPVFHGGAGGPAFEFGQYNWVFKEDVKLLGFSVANEFGGMSFGMDIVYRMDTPFNPNLGGQLQHVGDIPPNLPPNFVALLGAGLAQNGFSFDYWDINEYDSGNYPGATGDSAHLVLNGLKFLSPSSFWDGGVWLFETTLSKVVSVNNKNKHLLNNRLVGKDTLGTIAVTFAPAWFQVAPGLDLRLPMNFSYNYMGEVAPQIFGGTEGYGSGAVTLRAVYNNVWNADLRYAYSFGPRDEGLAGNVIDRDNISITFKRTF